MSTTSPGQREIAHRIFAVEFDDATVTETQSEDERAPNYVIAPTGALVNRVFLVGVLTETEWVNDETVRARVVDPTGAFVLYASQYQPDARAVLDETEPPAFIAVTGKANTFRPDGSDRILTSVRPEAVAQVDGSTRDRWAVSTARLTIARLGELARAMEVDAPTDRGVQKALSAYDISPGYVATLYEQCIAVLQLVAGEIEAIPEQDFSLNSAAEPTIPLTQIIDVADQLDGTKSPTRPDDPPEPPDGEAVTEAVESSEATDIDPTEPVLTSEERADIESSFGTEFTTGDEIGLGDEAVDDGAPVDAEMSMEDATETNDHPENDAALTKEGSPDPAEPAQTPEASVDGLIDLMESLDDGDGVNREALIDRATDDFDISTSDASALLQDALLSGRCYEADEDVIRPI